MTEPTAGRLPVNIKCMFEGEEEIGSPSLDAFIQEHRALLAADVVVSADGAMWRINEPSLTVASRGLAVLTYERRGFGGSTGNPRAGFVAHASDAAAALRYLEGRPEVDPHRVGIRGQSQGAWLAPLAAQQVPVAFVIATGGGGIPPWQSELYAVPARMQADRLPPELIADARRYMERMFKVAATGQGWDGFHDMVEELRGRNVTWLDRYAPQYDTQEDLQAAWKRDFSYDPAPALRALRSPLLALMGDHDAALSPILSFISARSAPLWRSRSRSWYSSGSTTT